MWLAGRQLCALPVLGWRPASLGGHVGGAGTFPCELTLKPGESQVQLPAWTYWLSHAPSNVEVSSPAPWHPLERLKPAQETYS